MSMPNNPEFGRRWKEVRQRHKENQYEMAARMRITQAYVSQVERHGVIPSIEIVKRLCEVYGESEPEWMMLAGYTHLGLMPARELLSGLVRLARKYELTEIPTIYLDMVELDAMNNQDVNRILAAFEAVVLGEIGGNEPKSTEHAKGVAE